MLGDGTGVGKGRTCAGIICDYFLHKRQQRPSESSRPVVCVWVSVSWDLAQDARRDLAAITETLDTSYSAGAANAGDVILPVVSVKDALSSSFSLRDYSRTGVVIFSTYSVFSRKSVANAVRALR